jgi:hypothetical protein
MAKAGHAVPFGRRRSIDDLDSQLLGQVSKLVCADDDASQVIFLEADPGEVGAAPIGLCKLRLGKIRIGEIAVDEYGAGQLGEREIGPDERAALEIHFRQVQTAEIGIVQFALANFRRGQGYVLCQVETDHPAVAELGREEIRTWDLGAGQVATGEG